MRIAPDGTQELVAQQVDTTLRRLRAASERYTIAGTLPNGLAFDRNGDILIANFGTRRDRADDPRRALGRRSPPEIDGLPLGKTNFVLVDSRDRIWFTVTTRLEPVDALGEREGRRTGTSA